MVFFENLHPALKSYWIESDLEFCQNDGGSSGKYLVHLKMIGPVVVVLIVIPGKWNVGRVAFQEFKITYTML